MHNLLRLKKRQNQKGIGLLEILITIVLLSIGFLAAARMQVEGMRFSQSAYFQSQAYFLANDMINRMRTNSKGATDGHYNGVTTVAGAQNPGCTTKACNPKDIALQDLFEWSGYFYPRDNATNFVAALPSSDSIAASATVTSVDDDIYAVSLVWSELIGKDYQRQTLSMNFALKKYTL